MSAGLAVADWPEGTTTYGVHGLQVTDGRGIVRGYFRVGSSTLMFAEPPAKPKDGKAASKPSFRDCTDRWAAFPSWVRREVQAKVTGAGVGR